MFKTYNDYLSLHNEINIFLSLHSNKKTDTDDPHNFPRWICKGIPGWNK